MTKNSNYVGPANILIVDDHPGNRLVLEAVLGDSPEYKTVTASSGQEAIDLVKTMDFALILLDLQMPNMDGYETSRRIKQLDKGKDIPIIMVTAIFKEDPHVIKGYEAGALDYIGKPFNPDILKAKVNVYANLYLRSQQIILQNKFLQAAEKALSDTRDIKAVVETMPVGVIVTDKQGTITQMNKEATHIWGGSKYVDITHYNEYVGWWSESGKAINPEEWALARAVTSGEVSQNEVINIQCFDGTKKTILNSASPVKDSLGAIIGAVDVIQDITRLDY